MVDVLTREPETTEEETAGRRWLPFAAVAVMMIAVAIVIVVVLTGGNDEGSLDLTTDAVVAETEADGADTASEPAEPDPTTPDTELASGERFDLEANPSHVGFALSSAWESADPQVFDDLFASDVTVTQDGRPSSLAQLAHPGPAHNGVFGTHQVWTGCRTPSGGSSTVSCDTSWWGDWLAPLLPQPVRGTVTIRIDEGKITNYSTASSDDVFAVLGPFAEWTRESHPEVAESIWSAEGLDFTEELALSHQELWREFLEVCAPDGTIQC